MHEGDLSKRQIIWAPSHHGPEMLAGHHAISDSSQDILQEHSNRIWKARQLNYPTLLQLAYTGDLQYIPCKFRLTPRPKRIRLHSYLLSPSRSRATLFRARIYAMAEASITSIAAACPAYVSPSTSTTTRTSPKESLPEVIARTR